MTGTMHPTNRDLTAHRLLQLGVLLFLVGLLIGFLVPAVANPRMGLAAHLQGILNGLFLVALGLLWPRLRLTPTVARMTFALACYGTCANPLATLLAAITGAGRSMPLATGQHHAAPWIEGIVDGLLYSLSLAMVSVGVLVLAGLRREHARPAPTDAPPAATERPGPGGLPPLR